MAITEAETTQAKQGAARRWLWRGLPYALSFAGVALFALLALSLAYQVRPSYTVNVGGRDDRAFVDGFYAREPAQPPKDYTGPDYRWTGAQSTVYVPGVGAQPFVVTLRLARAANPDPHLRVLVNGHPVPNNALVLSDNAYHDLRFNVSADWLDSGDLKITLQTTPFTPQGDPRRIGVVLDTVQVAPERDGFVMPAPAALGQFITLVVLLTFTLLCFGAGIRIGTGAGLAAAVGLALWLALARTSLTLFTRDSLVPLFVGTWIGVWTLSAVLPYIFSQLRLPMSRVEGRWLAGLFGFQFVLLVAAMLHPQFTSSDAAMHAHNIQDVARGILIFTEPLPGGQPAPYPPGYYMLLQPFTAITGLRDPALIGLLKISGAILQCSEIYIVFALVGLLRKANTSGGHFAGLLAAAFYTLLRFPFLTFSQGNYTNIFGAWTLLVFGGLLAGWLRFAPKSKWARWGYVVLLTAALFVVFLGHYGTFLFANAFLGCALVALGLWRRWRHASALLSMWIVALAVAFGLYYSHLLDVLTQTSQAGGAKARPDLLTAVGRLLADLHDNFGLVGLAAVVGLVLWVRSRPIWRDLDAVTLMLLAFGLTCAVFAIATYGVPIESRYQLYAGALVTVAAGNMFAWLWCKGWRGRAGVIALFVVQFGLTLSFWIARLPYYS